MSVVLGYFSSKSQLRAQKGGGKRPATRARGLPAKATMLVVATEMSVSADVLSCSPSVGEVTMGTSRSLLRDTSYQNRG